MNDNRPTRFSTPRGRTSSRSAPRKQKGFSDLDPSNMGLDMPDWMQADSAYRDGVSAPEAKALPPEIPSESSSLSRTITEGMKVVCICKGIKKRAFWNALDEGICTKEDINRATGSGSGSCQGRRCGPRILDMIRHITQ